MDKVVSLVLLAYAVCVCAQQYGPVPPRPQSFPGATLIQPPPRQHFRQRFNGPRVPESFQAIEHLSPHRSRRPQPVRKINPLVSQQQILEHPKATLIEDVPVPIQFTNTVSTPLPQFQPVTNRALTPRPVEEDVNEEEAARSTLTVTQSTPAYTTALRPSFAPTPAPVVLSQAQLPAAFPKTQYLTPNAFRGSPFQSVQGVSGIPAGAVPVPVSVALPELPLQGRPIVRQQIRPVQQAPLPANRSPSLPVVASTPAPKVPQLVSVQPQPVQDEEYFRPIQTRPLKKHEPVRQQIIERDQYKQYPSKHAEAPRQQQTQQDYSKPAPRQPHVKAPQREKKPVAQTIRKYHEEHEDGSITWGYENDDGSFKEETIGVDCVTRGKYGYYDPDGVKREYTYQTGIPCNKPEENEEAESVLHGYIDYTNNKYVFPNGDEIDLEAMVKNRARKPVSQHRIRS